MHWTIAGFASPYLFLSRFQSGKTSMQTNKQTNVSLCLQLGTPWMDEWLSVCSFTLYCIRIFSCQVEACLNYLNPKMGYCYKTFLKRLYSTSKLAPTSLHPYILYSAGLPKRFTVVTPVRPSVVHSKFAASLSFDI